MNDPLLPVTLCPTKHFLKVDEKESFPVGKYMLKVTKKDAQTNAMYIVLMYLLLTLISYWSGERRLPFHANVTFL